MYVKKNVAINVRVRLSAYSFRSCKSLAPYRFWRGLYNRFDRGMHPRQSIEDYLSAIQEETQQLEEQLASHKQVGQKSHRSPFHMRKKQSTAVFFHDCRRWLLPYVINRKLLSWRRSKGGGVLPRKQPPLIRAPQRGPTVMTSVWPTPLRTTPGASSPAAPVSPKCRTAAWSSCPRTCTSHLKPASQMAAIRSRGLQTWVAVHPSVRTAPGIQTPMRLPTQLPEQM